MLVVCLEDLESIDACSEIHLECFSSPTVECKSIMEHVPMFHDGRREEVGTGNSACPSVVMVDRSCKMDHTGVTVVAANR